MCCRYVVVYWMQYCAILKRLHWQVTALELGLQRKMTLRSFDHYNNSYPFIHLSHCGAPISVQKTSLVRVRVHVECRYREWYILLKTTPFLIRKISNKICLSKNTKFSAHPLLWSVVLRHRGIILRTKSNEVRACMCTYTQLFYIAVPS